MSAVDSGLHTRTMKPGLRATRRRLLGFGKDERGVTAVEFGLVALPFIALMFAILETALVFFAGQALETAIGNSARLIRTGQAQEDNMSLADFRTSICDQVFQLFDCEGGLQLDVRTFPTFDSIELGTPEVDEDGVLVTEGYDFDIGEAGEIVVVRAYYAWPVFVTMLGNDLSNYGNSEHLLIATAAFKNEPFPW
jgi:Flp pilus assembly pilin Flp